MLTDYHVHLRPDDPDTARRALLHRRPTPSATARSPSERGIAELGVAEHIHRFTAALDVWQHPFWRARRVDDLDDYVGFVREETDLRLGIEADFVPGREDRMRDLLDARDWDYVVGSVHFLGDQAVDSRRLRHLGHERAPPRRRLAPLLRDARRGRARTGLFDIIAHPDLVKVWGRARPWPDGDLRRFYEPRVEAIAEARRRHGGLDRRAAQAGRRDLPGARRSSRWRSTPGSRSRCPATRTRPSSSATATSRRSSCSTSSA